MEFMHEIRKREFTTVEVIIKILYHFGVCLWLAHSQTERGGLLTEIESFRVKLQEDKERGSHKKLTSDLCTVQCTDGQTRASIV